MSRSAAALCGLALAAVCGFGPGRIAAAAPSLSLSLVHSAVPPLAAAGAVPSALSFLSASAAPAASAAFLPLPASSATVASALPVDPATQIAPWLDRGRPTPLARATLALLADAGSHGLQPQDYLAAPGQWLPLGLARAEAAPLHDPAEAMRWSRALAAALQRYLSDLHGGRVDPRRVHHGFEPPARGPFDAAAVVREVLQAPSALAVARLGEAAAAAASPLPVYQALRRALAAMLPLEGHAAWAQPLPPLPRPAPGRGPATTVRKLEHGAVWIGTALMAERLRLLGDLAPAAAVPSLIGPPPADTAAPYEGELVAAVQRFQARHGLAPDGVVGAATLAALAVPPAQRRRQIELSLERLRWTPLLGGDRRIVVNVPEFVLRAYEVEGGRIRLRETMKVIVGRARNTRTPLFAQDMQFIEFAPYWNVPPSIARGELVPRLRRDPGHFEREGYEFVGPGGRVVTALDPELLDAVPGGGWRIRQRPGPRNALGDIKFVFPNSDNIFLHHTPAVALFEREQRDFSHGCIRVEAPVALAQWVLEGEPEWDETRIRAAMATASSRTIRLRRPVPVVIAYATALVIEGELRFFPDLYGYDRLLDAALRAPRPPLAISPADAMRAEPSTPATSTR